MLTNNEEVEKLERLESKAEEEMNFETEDVKIIEKEISLEVDSEDKEQQDIKTTTVECVDSNIAFKKIGINSLEKPTTKAHQMRVIGKADFSVVNAGERGRRVKISRDLSEKLGIKEIDKDTIDIAFTPYGVVLSKNLSNIGERFHLNKGGHIYSKALVGEITERFKLQFGGITTRSFSNPEYQELDNGCIVAIIKM